LLYTKRFNFPDGKARFYPLQWIEPSEQIDEEFDLHLNNGRVLEHFHEGNMTYRVNGIRQKTPDNWIEISPELAAERKIETGNWVELTSRRGRVRVRALVTDRVQGHELYMPMNSSENAVNRLTSSVTDRATHTPAYKETAVKLKVLGEHGEPPLPRNNFRFGHPTPQNGVEVERKWKRLDYYLPGTRSGALEKLHKLPLPAAARTSRNGEHSSPPPRSGATGARPASESVERTGESGQTNVKPNGKNNV
jgi:formate dehydrogenase major subunit